MPRSGQHQPYIVHGRFGPVGGFAVGYVRHDGVPLAEAVDRFDIDGSPTLAALDCVDGVRLVIGDMEHRAPHRAAFLRVRIGERSIPRRGGALAPVDGEAETPIREMADERERSARGDVEELSRRDARGIGKVEDGRLLGWTLLLCHIAW